VPERSPLPVRAVAVLALLVGALPWPAWAETRDAQAGPPAAAVASSHPDATRAGFEILAAGGNAFDAAVAVSAALSVVDPYSAGLGGGGLWLLHRQADGRQVMIDGRERAPLAARRDMYLDTQGKVVAGASIDGPLAAAIPGLPAGLTHLARHYGSLPLAQSLAPAIRLAQEGFRVTEHYEDLAWYRRDVLKRWPGARGIFMDEGKVPDPGYLLRQPDLARTLQSLAAGGDDGFYAGPVAKALVDGVRGAGGIWTLQDLADYRVIEREPVRFRYRDTTVVSAALPSSGGILLGQMLNVLSGYDMAGMDEAGRAHVIVEAMRRAYRDRAQWLGDADFVEVPQKRLLDRQYAAELRAGISLERATPSDSLPGIAARDGGNDTTHFSVLDRDGNRVAATLTINYAFGSGFVAPGTGVLLNDEMDDFSLQPGVPNVYGLLGADANAIAPGKRPLSSMSPTFLENRRGIGILGTPGGSRIISMVLLAILDFDAGNGAQSWVEVPRFHHQYYPDAVICEPGGLDVDLMYKLQQRGHKIKQLANSYGNMQAVFWELEDGRVEAASDPRLEGLAEVR